MKYCNNCKAEFNPENIKPSGLKYRHYLCKECAQKKHAIHVSTPEGKARLKRKAQRHRLQRLKLRMLALEHYSKGTPVCSCCGEDHIIFLTIDHINNDGAQHRRVIRSNSSDALYRWLKRHNYPNGYQVLCMNCNWAKGRLGYCPHNTSDRLK